MNITVKMLSKVAFVSLAFACVDATYAADIGTTPGVPAKLYLKGNILMLDVGYTPGTLISIF